MSTPPVLQTRHLSKSFGGARALDGVSLTVQPGEVHGLLGENGSGKSTLIKVLAGFHSPDQGEVMVNGQEVNLPLLPGESQRLGFEFVHQDLGLVPSLSVAENLFMEEIAHPQNSLFMSWPVAQRRAREIFSRYGLAIDPTAPVEAIRPVEGALLAIVRAMEGLSRYALDVPTLLVLDEPTVFLPEQEISFLFGFVRKIASSGSSVLFVSHDLDEVMQITDSITVLRDGRVAGEVATRDTSTHELVRLIIGRDLKPGSPRDTLQREDFPAMFEVHELSTRRLSNVSLNVGVGEIVGLTGLVGSGYDDVLYALFGAVTADAGWMQINDTTVELRSLNPRGAMKHGIALVPGDRQRLGSLPDLTVAENINVLALDRFGSRVRVRPQALRSSVSTLLEEFDVRPRQADIAYGSLSGGNQQKALMAKWFQIGPRLLLLDEPTQGVDVGARQQIWDVIKRTSSTTSTICASADYEQLAGLCHRVGVVARGRLIGFLGGAELTKDRLAEFCLRSSAETSVIGSGADTDTPSHH